MVMVGPTTLINLMKERVNVDRDLESQVMQVVMFAIKRGTACSTACNVYQTCLLKVSFNAISSAVCLLLQASAGGTEPGQDFC